MEIASTVVLLVYSALMLGYRHGQTLGKQVANVRVRRAVAREVVKAIFA